jgi:ABC-type phosphate/phosphonate transport system ATPase subunit
MEVTIVGLQNAGKTSLLRVLAVSVSVASNFVVKRRRDLSVKPTSLTVILG